MGERRTLLSFFGGAVSVVSSFRSCRWNTRLATGRIWKGAKGEEDRKKKDQAIVYPWLALAPAHRHSDSCIAVVVLVLLHPVWVGKIVTLGLVRDNEGTGAVGGRGG